MGVSVADTLQDVIEHRRASADALDDPEDIENQAIRDWMRHNVAFRYHQHKYVVVKTVLPVRWRDRAVKITTPEDVLPMLRSLKREPSVLASLRRVFGSVGPAVCTTDDGMIAILADEFAHQRIWLFRDAKSPPIAVLTDPAVYTALNGQFQTAVDFLYLARWEGKQFLRGYVPFIHGVTAGRSGITVATGFDVGQIGADDLGALGLPASLVPKLLPFAGRTFKGMTRAQVAARVLQLGAVPTLTKAEADAADLVVHRKHLAAAIAAWNARRQPNVPEFKALPSNWQTVLFSRTFHQGVGMPDTAVARVFYAAATSGKWAEAVAALRNYPVPEIWYRERVQKEAALLQTKLPPPVAAANAAPPGPAKAKPP
ncbi:MAG: hypothetical protein NVSMB18_14250 [Acetobacteraceae bacterium]